MSDRLFVILSRRRFLKVALGAGGAVLGGGAAFWAWLRGGAPDVEGLRILEAYEHRTLASLVEVIVHPAGVDVAALDVPRLVDGYLADEPEQNVSDLRDALTYLELGPLLDEHRAVTFSRLSRAEREAFFRRWMTSDDLVKRQIALAFRKLVNLLVYDHEELWANIHYPGPLMGRRG